jgi:hypothetical protein
VIERISVTPWQWRQALTDRYAPAAPAARVVALVIEAHMSRSEARAWPGQTQIAARARLSERTVRRALDALDDAGWIKRTEEKRPGRRWKLTVYEPAVPATLAHTIKSHAGDDVGADVPAKMAGAHEVPSATTGQVSASTGQMVGHDRPSAADDRPNNAEDRTRQSRKGPDSPAFSPHKSSSEVSIGSTHMKSSPEGAVAPIAVSQPNKMTSEELGAARQAARRAAGLSPRNGAAVPDIVAALAQKACS